MKTIFLRLTATLFSIVVCLLPPSQAARLPPHDGIGPQLTPDLQRSPSAGLLEQSYAKPCLEPTPLIIDSDAYTSRCNEGKGPCFELVGTTMQAKIVEPWHEPLNMTEHVIVADSIAHSFTMRDPSVAFTITFDVDSALRFRYMNYDAADGCYNVTLSRWKSKHRLSVGQKPGERELDTLNHEETGKRFCTDKLLITVEGVVLEEL
ncbi:hypothetical protein PSEUBRA_005837 [Kalmanozyma brasiliensis GHG001]|uniref:uncharacterized protein n=1 Tax=Kalmanozyma brasiliensis (strain GHG001) TaxID=1365824 RepID=UPI0028683414|nr:uncharacterized protein PSEUBRA_005837 [Kalmanozyma brasiliensis GHG001]EST05029.2 hypothetical protein PSEUBRA_005837 [Kalmanozyma brasiliensis GHG001]